MTTSMRSTTAENHDNPSGFNTEETSNEDTCPKVGQVTLSHEITSIAQVADTVTPGLSPIFCTTQLTLFHQYISAVMAKKTSRAIPTASVQDGVLTVAVSFPHTGKPDDGALLTSDVATRIAIAVPALAASNGYTHFRVWLESLLLSHRTRLSPREFWYCRLIPFLTLPVLHVPSPPTTLVCDFRQRVETLSAALGSGIFIASFSLKTQLPSFRFVPPDRRTDRLCSRFQALVFSVVTSVFSDCTTVCFAERALFESAASAFFPTCASLLAITPVRNSAHDRVSPLWRPGISAWLGICSEASQGLCLPDVIDSIRQQSQSTSIAIRDLFVRTADGNSSNWIVVTSDTELPSVSLIAMIANDTVVCSAAAVLDSPSDFLNLTADVDIAFENDAFCEAVGDLLSDAGLFSDGDVLVDACIIENTDDILLAKLSTSYTLQP